MKTPSFINYLFSELIFILTIIIWVILNTYSIMFDVPTFDFIRFGYNMICGLGVVLSYTTFNQARKLSPVFFGAIGILLGVCIVMSVIDLVQASILKSDTITALHIFSFIAFVGCYMTTRSLYYTDHGMPK